MRLRYDAGHALAEPQAAHRPIGSLPSMRCIGSKTGVRCNASLFCAGPVHCDRPELNHRSRAGPGLTGVGNRIPAGGHLHDHAACVPLKTRMRAE